MILFIYILPSLIIMIIIIFIIIIIIVIIIIAEAVVERCSVKKVFLKISHLAQIFACEFCEIFKNTFFTEHLRTTASIIRFISRVLHLLTHSLFQFFQPIVVLTSFIKNVFFRNLRFGRFKVQLPSLRQILDC